MAEHDTNPGAWRGRAASTGRGAPAMAPALWRPSPRPAAGDDAVWAASVSAAARRLPSLLHILADVALTARVPGHRAVHVLEDGPSAGGWQVALSSTAAFISDESGVALDVRSVSEVCPGHDGAAPLGCVAIDLDNVDASRGLEVLGHVSRGTAAPGVGTRRALAKGEGADAF